MVRTEDILHSGLCFWVAKACLLFPRCLFLVHLPNEPTLLGLSCAQMSPQRLLRPKLCAKTCLPQRMLAGQSSQGQACSTQPNYLQPHSWVSPTSFQTHTQLHSGWDSHSEVSPLYSYKSDNGKLQVNSQERLRLLRDSLPKASSREVQPWKVRASS